MTLNDLKQGESGIITKVKGRGAFRNRITEMGFVKGRKVEVVKSAPLKDPVEYKIMGYAISLRRSEASLIEMITESDTASFHSLHHYEGVTNDDILKTSAKEKGNTIDIALVGNPNSGKTSLFNFASNSKEHVGNYSGVTIDAKSADFKFNDYHFNLTDLPGTYSISAYTPEELYVRKFIFDERPDVVINVIDASNLERNLFLSTQLIDMDIKVVIALNMFDELEETGNEFDYIHLGKMIGIPMIPTVGSKGKGVKELFNKVIEVYEDKEPTVRHIHINYGANVEDSIKNIQEEIKKNKSLTDKISSRFLAIKLLEKDEWANNVIVNWDNYFAMADVLKKETTRLENLYSEDSETLVADARYGFIAGALKETFHFKTTITDVPTTTKKIDDVLTHRIWGYPIFLFFLWVMFQSTFKLGEYPVRWIEDLVKLTGSSFQKWMPDGMLKDLLINGMVHGVGGVIVFLPNILILFLFISVMEDTGYMARAAFIMDKLMHKIGLHGKSFIPLIMGFGCNVPAIMSTRTLENKSDRILTILINPFMSCSARLPVYILITSAIFAEYAGTVLFSIYMIGILLAILVAIIFSKFVFKSKDVPFVMELPPYRIPTLRATYKHVWHKSGQYLKKMGGVILFASIIIWALGYFPRKTDKEEMYSLKIKKLEQTYAASVATSLSKDTADLNKQKDLEINKLVLEEESYRQENSFIGKIGHFVEPVMRPLGFDWKMSVSLLAGVAAKEIVVSTMGVIYQADDKADEHSTALISKLKNETYKTGKNKDKNVFSPLVGFSFLLFVLIYFPCVAVFAAVKKEAGGIKWALFLAFYTTVLAWFISFLVFQIGSIFLK
ncbi:MAG: ferrous iron transport protein B [Bacteroidetes bacterium]|nr:ferrous iron transport protein B [Bacteroidota bacterium]